VDGSAILSKIGSKGQRSRSLPKHVWSNMVASCQILCLRNFSCIITMQLLLEFRHSMTTVLITVEIPMTIILLIYINLHFTNCCLGLKLRGLHLENCEKPSSPLCNCFHFT